MDITVRRAEARDLETIVTMNHALFQEDGARRDPYININWALAEGEQYFSDHLASGNSLVLGAEIKGKIAGYLVGYLRNGGSVRPVKVAELESMFVQAPLRSEGVGRQLVEAFFAWCRDQDAERIFVTAYASNEGAVRFYQRAGFEPLNLSLERPV